MRFKDILVPTDFSESSAHALDLAIEVASAFHAKLTLVHVYEIPAYAYPGMNFAAADLLTAVEKSAQIELDKLLAETQKRVPSTQAILRRGVAWSEILSVIEQTDADLVIMGTHGRRGFERALLGSVTEKVVRLSPVPVLTARHRAR